MKFETCLINMWIRKIDMVHDDTCWEKWFHDIRITTTLCRSGYCLLLNFDVLPLHADYVMEYCNNHIGESRLFKELSRGQSIDILDMIANDLNGEFKDDNFWTIFSIGGKYDYDITDNGYIYSGETKFSSGEIAQLVIENYEPLLNKIYKCTQ